MRMWWRRGRWGGALALSVLVAAAPAAAQQFSPPRAKASGKTKIGLYGFGVRAGIDPKGAGQVVLGTTLDIGNLFSNRVRLRPSVEVGVFNGANTYIASFESLWRFTDDEEVATPYLGAGMSIAGHADCGADPDCPGLWLNAVLGFELRYRSTFNWVVEYHAMDLFRRHRFYIGLTTRRGN